MITGEKNNNVLGCLSGSCKTILINIQLSHGYKGLGDSAMVFKAGRPAKLPQGNPDGVASLIQRMKLSECPSGRLQTKTLQLPGGIYFQRGQFQGVWEFFIYYNMLISSQLNPLCPPSVPFPQSIPLAATLDSLVSAPSALLLSC